MGRPEKGHVIFDRSLIGKPEQRRAVIAQGVRNFPSRRFSPDRYPGHPFRCIARQVLLHERRLARANPDHRERSTLKARNDPSRYCLEVVDQIALGRAGAVKELLIKVSERNAVSIFARTTHESIIASLRTEPRT